MRKRIFLVITAFSFLVAPVGAIGVDEAKQAIIQESIASYPGTSACPYSMMRSGARCGARSAYSKPGGEAPLCYPADVSDAMVNSYLTRTGQKLTGTIKR